MKFIFSFREAVIGVINAVSSNGIGTFYIGLYDTYFVSNETAPLYQTLPLTQPITNLI